MIQQNGRRDAQLNPKVGQSGISRPVFPSFFRHLHFLSFLSDITVYFSIYTDR